MFRLLYHHMQIHPVFMEIVTSFGFKIMDGDEYFTPSFSNFAADRSLIYGNAVQNPCIECMSS